jgi:hypothetical protein
VNFFRGEKVSDGKEASSNGTSKRGSEFPDKACGSSQKSLPQEVSSDRLTDGGVWMGNITGGNEQVESDSPSDTDLWGMDWGTTGFRGVEKQNARLGQSLAWSQSDIWSINGDFTVDSSKKGAWPADEYLSDGGLWMGPKENKNIAPGAATVNGGSKKGAQPADKDLLSLDQYNIAHNKGARLSETLSIGDPVDFGMKKNAASSDQPGTTSPASPSAGNSSPRQQNKTSNGVDQVAQSGSAAPKKSVNSTAAPKKSVLFNDGAVAEPHKFSFSFKGGATGGEAAHNPESSTGSIKKVVRHKESVI